MKLFWIFIVFALTITNTSFAKVIKYEPWAQDEYGVIFKVRASLILGHSGEDMMETWLHARNNAKTYCQNMQKETYAFFKIKPGNIWVLDDGDDDFRAYYRFFCASSAKEALGQFNRAGGRDRFNHKPGQLQFSSSEDYFQTNKFANQVQREETIKQTANDEDRRIETCKKYGFKEGTEKLGDCVMKIMEIEMKQLDTHRQMEAANQSANQQRALALQQQKLIETQQLNESIKMMQMGLDMWDPPNRNVSPPPTLQHNPLAPRPNINCQFIGNNMHCN